MNLTLYVNAPKVARSLIGDALDTRAGELLKERSDVRVTDRESALTAAAREPLAFDDAANLRVEGGELVFESNGKRTRIAVVDIDTFRIDDGPKRTLPPNGLRDGPLV